MKMLTYRIPPKIWNNNKEVNLEQNSEEIRTNISLHSKRNKNI